MIVHLVIDLQKTCVLLEITFELGIMDKKLGKLDKMFILISLILIATDRILLDMVLHIKLKLFDFVWPEFDLNYLIRIKCFDLGKSANSEFKAVIKIF